MDWAKYRRDDGTIDLVDAFGMCYGGGNSYNDAVEYLRYVEQLQLINSRQAAAIALATAIDISNR